LFEEKNKNLDYADGRFLK